ncbi:unnamed protein product [Hymenolepis diminuta]|uniref:WD_REPEATS_REGION domain-containing protein n=1 Tax=Hymenolepis diminuta TaxID=6216 RepID=A0A158QEV2_HYMDI|nr:unnamed protein product [Hymenolepis diminuta]
MTKFLAVEILSINGENLISEGGSIRFITDCAGGHRAWDFAYNSLDDSFTFAAIQKDSVLFTRQRVERIQSVCGFRRKCLIPSLHGRDINTCLLIPRKMSNADEGDLIINCYTGSEDFCLGSFALEIKGSTTSKGPAVSYYNSSTPTFHSGHISNIRCLISVNSYLISGGGRGMLAVWRLDCDHTNQPGLIGWISLDTGVRESGPLYSCPIDKTNRNVKSMCDLRVMTLLGYQTHQECIFVIAGCSDGSIR